MQCCSVFMQLIVFIVLKVVCIYFVSLIVFYIVRFRLTVV